MRNGPVQLDLLDWLVAQAPCPAAAEPLPLPPAPDGTGSVLLIRVDPSCNMRRFYSVALATSLFGECGVVRQWGRIGTEGQSRTNWYDEPREAESVLKDLLQAKRKRGYGS
jgi:predicted DNA-binding WGR domain protein